MKNQLVNAQVFRLAFSRPPRFYKVYSAGDGISVFKRLNQSLVHSLPEQPRTGVAFRLQG